MRHQDAAEIGGKLWASASSNVAIKSVSVGVSARLLFGKPGVANVHNRHKGNDDRGRVDDPPGPSNAEVNNVYGVL